MANPSAFGKFAAELEPWPSGQQATAGRTRWSDLIFKRGVTEVPAWSLVSLRAGETFSMEVPQAATPQATLANLKTAVAHHRVLGLTVIPPTSTQALSRCSKVEALALKQKVSEVGPVVEIQLRKL